MRIMRIWPFFLAGALVFSSLTAQEGHGKGRLSGRVKTVDGQPIAEAKIVLRLLGSESSRGRPSVSGATSQESAAFMTKTDQKGMWSFLGLATGTWEISASADGYHSASRECQVYQLRDSPRVELALERLEHGTSAIAPDLLAKADDLAYRKKYGEAIALYRQYLEQDPEAIMVSFAIADCLIENGQLEDASAQLQAIVDRTSADPRDKELCARALARLGECHLKRGDVPAAIKSWMSSCDVSPTNAETAYTLAEALFSARKPDEAVRYYRLAAEITPRWADPHYKLGLLYLNQEMHPQAKESFMKVIEIEPSSQRASQARAIIGDLEKIKKKEPLPETAAGLIRIHH